MKKYSGWILLAASVALIVVGVISAQYSEVWQKAVRVCLECVGLG